ncbi:MAG: hypothetical protein ABI417_17410 [Coleofasciculaceae cyanobacterium]
MAILRLLIVVNAIADLQAIITTLQAASMRFFYDAATTSKNYQQFLHNTYDAVLAEDTSNFHFSQDIFNFQLFITRLKFASLEGYNLNPLNL